MVTGKDAHRILSGVLTAVPPDQGTRILCHVQDTQGRIDQIVAGHETSDSFALHCHGNPLIVERIMACLKTQGAQLVEGNTLLPARNTLIESEIDQALALTRTLRGASLLSQQRERGLLPLLRRWQKKSVPLPEIQGMSRALLGRYDAARRLIHGCRVTLVGPPNSGKSSLFNRLLGIEKSIVTDIEGTTRDWVDGALTLPDLYLHLYDTAGLDRDLVSKKDGHLDWAAQDRALCLLEQTDVYLLVLDNSQPNRLGRSWPLERLTPCKTLVVLNKSDLPPRLDAEAYSRYPNIHRVSALHDTGLIDLIEGIRSASGAARLDVKLPAPFTARQRDLLAALANAADESSAETFVHALLFGKR
jgi:tRNA modification GTPase